MKSLTEHVADQKLEQYLIEDLTLLMRCIANFDYMKYGIKEYKIPCLFEVHGRLNGMGPVIEYIFKYLDEHIEDEFFVNNKNTKEFTLDVSKFNIYCKYIKFYIGIDKSINAELLNTSNQEKIEIKLNLELPVSFDSNIVQGIILHELLHGYENYCRLKNGKPSLFAELSKEYINVVKNVRVKKIKKNEFIYNLKYLFDYHEQNANLSTLKQLIDKIIIELNIDEIFKFDFDEVLNKLKKTEPWDQYFNFVKLMLVMDQYDDKELEESYYLMTLSQEERNKDMRDHIDKLSKGENHKYIKKIKSANEIRKEAKQKINRFTKKFNQVFMKSLFDSLEENVYEKHIHLIPSGLAFVDIYELI